MVILSHKTHEIQWNCAQGVSLVLAARWPLCEPSAISIEKPVFTRNTIRIYAIPARQLTKAVRLFFDTRFVWFLVSLCNDYDNNISIITTCARRIFFSAHIHTHKVSAMTINEEDVILFGPTSDMNKSATAVHNGFLLPAVRGRSA